MFAPNFDNPLHNIYREERQEFFASLDIDSQRPTAHPQHIIDHRKSNLKKPLLNRASGSPTVPQKKTNRVRWNSPVSSIRFIPAREDSDSNDIFTPNFSDAVAQQILENATPSLMIPPSKQQKTVSIKPSKPNNQPLLIPKQYNFGNANDSITRIIHDKTAPEDIHYLNLNTAQFLPSKPKLFANSNSKAQTQPAHDAIVEDTSLVARMNLRFLAQSAGQSHLYTPKPQSPASSSTIPGRAKSLLPTLPNHLSTDKKSNQNIVPKHNKPVPLGSWSSENKPSSSQLCSDDLKQIERLPLLKRKGVTRENERPAKIIKTKGIVTEDSREHSPILENNVSSVLGDEIIYPDSDGDPPTPSDSEDSDDDADGLFGDQEAQFLPEASLVDVRQCTTFNNSRGAKADPQASTWLSRPPVMKVDELKVTRWIERLDKYATLRTVQVEKWNAKLADALYELLCSINTVKMDPYLEPRVLAETQLAKTMKQFRHSKYSMATRVIADEITKYWRQMCREVALKDEDNAIE